MQRAGATERKPAISSIDFIFGVATVSSAFGSSRDAGADELVLRAEPVLAENRSPAGRVVDRGDLELRFDFDPVVEARIREELRAKGRSTPVFEFGFYRADGVLCTHVTNTVAIRPKGYLAQSGAYTPPGKAG